LSHLVGDLFELILSVFQKYEKKIFSGGFGVVLLL